MTTERPDFVNVQLTRFGAKLAGDGKLTVVEGGRVYEFLPGESQEVTKAFDWGMVLKNATIDGEQLFELVDNQQQGA
jgi:hypothetical protein